jgi:hypothetical protein
MFAPAHYSSVVGRWGRRIHLSVAIADFGVILPPRTIPSMPIRSCTSTDFDQTRLEHDSDSRSRRKPSLEWIMLRNGNRIENIGTTIRGELTGAAHRDRVRAGLGSAMRRGAFRGPRKAFSGLAIGAIVIALAMIGAGRQPAQALPSFARQTGQPCGTCHTRMSRA